MFILVISNCCAEKVLQVGRPIITQIVWVFGVGGYLCNDKYIQNLCSECQKLSYIWKDIKHVPILYIMASIFMGLEAAKIFGIQK